MSAGCDVYWSGHEGYFKATSASSSPCGQTGDARGRWVRDAVHACHGGHCHLLYASAQCSGKSEGEALNKLKGAGDQRPSVTGSPSHTSALWLYNELSVNDCQSMSAVDGCICRSVSPAWMSSMLSINNRLYKIFQNICQLPYKHPVNTFVYYLTASLQLDSSQKYIPFGHRKHRPILTNFPLLQVITNYRK